MAAIRVGVVGCRLGHSHALAYQLAAREGMDCTVVWAADLDPARAQATAEAVGAAPLSDWTTRLDDVDAISICTPHHLHKPMAIQAMRAGKHVLVEKPLANTEADCREMQRVARDHDVRLMCALLQRYRPTTVWLKQALDEQRWGPIHQINAWTHNLLEKPGEWFAKLEQLGGGVLFSNGCHDIDLIRWYMDAQPDEAHMVGSNLGAEWMEGEGTALCVLKFPGDRVAAYEASWARRHSAALGGMHINCRDALVITDYDTVDVVQGWRRDGERDGERNIVFRSRQPGEQPPPGARVIGEIRHFLECIAERKEPMTNAEDSLKTLRIIWQLYESSGYGLTHPARPTLEALLPK